MKITEFKLQEFPDMINLKVNVNTSILRRREYEGQNKTHVVWISSMKTCHMSRREEVGRQVIFEWERGRQQIRISKLRIKETDRKQKFLPEFELSGQRRPNVNVAHGDFMVAWRSCVRGRISGKQKYSNAVFRDESKDIRYEIVHRGIAGATLWRSVVSHCRASSYS